MTYLTLGVTRTLGRLVQANSVRVLQLADPWVGLDWVELFQFLVGLGWVHYSKSTKLLKGLC